jgi:hypothetical protein
MYLFTMPISLSQLLGHRLLRRADDCQLGELFPLAQGCLDNNSLLKDGLG